MYSTSSKQLAIVVVLLLLIIAATVLWAVSYDIGRYQVSWTRDGTRYTGRFECGDLIVYAPPRAKSIANVRLAEHWLANTANSDMGWRVLADGQFRVIAAYPLIFGDAQKTLPSGERIGKFDATNVAASLPPLLRALDDPDRYVVAHVILGNLVGFPKGASSSLRQQGGKIKQVWCNLEMELTPVFAAPATAPQEVANPKRQRVNAYCQGDQAVRIDPAQMPALSRMWHDRLDAQIIRVPRILPIATALLIILPALWLWAHKWSVKRARIRGGLCLACGYDVRESRERCPECGVALRNSESGGNRSQSRLI